jgi:rhodanese-related sulfurtransferase
MQTLMAFLVNHMMLTGGMVIVLVLLLIVEGLRAAQSKQGASVPEAVRLINREHALVIDLRPATLFQKGHILNAQMGAAKTLPDDLKKFEKYKHKPIILVCQLGQESQQIASRITHNAGLYYLVGGMRAWTEANMPVHAGM